MTDDSTRPGPDQVHHTSGGHSSPDGKHRGNSADPTCGSGRASCRSAVVYCSVPCVCVCVSGGGGRRVETPREMLVRQYPSGPRNSYAQNI